MRAFQVSDLVKVRFPPTKAELDATSRRLNHVSSWRGPCEIVDRLSNTTYRVVQKDTSREYERSVSNLYREKPLRLAKSAMLPIILPRVLPSLLVNSSRFAMNLLAGSI